MLLLRRKGRDRPSSRRKLVGQTVAVLRFSPMPALIFLVEPGDVALVLQNPINEGLSL